MIAIAMASQAGLAPVLLLVPAAREDGLGRAASGCSTVRATLSAGTGIAALVLFAGMKSSAGLALLIALVLFVFARLALRQIGGQTGEVLGAMQQLADLAAWRFVRAAASVG